MRSVTAFLRTLLRDEDGPTAVEYAVLLALIVGVCMTAISLLGGQTSAVFEAVSQALPAANAPPARPPAGPFAP